MTLDNNLLKKIENFKRNVLKSIPLPSTNTPSTDNTNGSTGSSLEYARSDHQHPKSTLYAESEHSHNDILSDLMDDINNTTVVVDSPNPIGQDGGTILLRGRMYGDDVSGKSIDYYIGNTLIGSSVTNGNGVSFLDYECDGLGVRNVTAKNGSIVSEPYSVCDAVFYDKALSGTGNHNDNWTSIANFTRGESSTSFSPSGNYSNSRIKINDSTDIAMGTYAIGVTISDVSKGTGDLRIGINDGSSRNISLQNGNYLIEMKDDGKIYISVNGTAQTPINYDKTANTFTVGFYNTTDSSASLNFKDFRIYPI